MSDSLLTAEEFASRDLLDDLGASRSELVAGRIVAGEEGDLLQGAVVFNLAKALARHLQQAPEANGYACFEIGLILARNPDTVRRPAISFFAGGQRFAELERSITETRPALVVEVPATNNRRGEMRERVESYVRWGVGTVWVADTSQRALHVIGRDARPRVLVGDAGVPAPSFLSGLRLRVGELFETEV
jgi:hypothetical protein